MNLAFGPLRVLGCLMEKEMVTPDLYPLSLNALVNAANQRSSREPVTDLTEDQVRDALDALETESLVSQARDGGRATRAVKYEHRIRTVLNLRRDETALLCLLLLRGPQTPGELRSRSDRMFPFDDLAQLQSALERMAAREQPLVAVLARVPGSREARWIHLLGDPAERPTPVPATEVASASSSELDSLRSTVESLEARVSALELRLRTLTTEAE